MKGKIMKTIQYDFPIVGCYVDESAGSAEDCNLRTIEFATPKQQAERAAKADYEYLRRWCNNQWQWCGYKISIEGMDYEDSLWGIDSDSIQEYTQECFEAAKAWLDKEQTETAWAINHDIQTI